MRTCFIGQLSLSLSEGKQVFDGMKITRFWHSWKIGVVAAVLVYALAAGCRAQLPRHGKATDQQTAPAAGVGQTPTDVVSFPSPTASLTPMPTEFPTIPATPTLRPNEPDGCLKPPEDYTLTNLNGYLFNQRTVFMLERAAELYDGEIDILGYAITQGSYTDAVSASFGTHAGGGAVDLSVMREGTYTVLYDEIELLISALREAGFAAWLRDLEELYPGSPIHIHAIAIGDRDLSAAAADQLTGESGYFRGYTGLPGTPAADRHGGSLICQWMLEAGYTDLRQTPTPPLPSFFE